MEMAGPIECPYDDEWTSNSADPVAVQLAQFLDHFEQKHSDQLPPAARATMKACARELEKIPV